MENNKSNLMMGYIPPIIEILSISVELGFVGSYGDEGAAGGDFGWGGEYEF